MREHEGTWGIVINSGIKIMIGSALIVLVGCSGGGGGGGVIAPPTPTPVGDNTAPTISAVSLVPCASNGGNSTNTLCASVAASDDVGVTDYSVTLSGPSGVVSTQTSTNGQFVFGSLTSNATYTGDFTARDAAGNVSNDFNKTATTDVVPTPMTSISVSGSRLLFGGTSDITAKFVEGTIPANFADVLNGLNNTPYSVNLTPALKGDANNGSYSGQLEIPEGKTGCIYIIGNGNNGNSMRDPALAERGDQTSVPQCFTTTGTNQIISADIVEILAESGTYDSPTISVTVGGDVGSSGEKYPLYATLTPEENVLATDLVPDIISKATITVLISSQAEVNVTYIFPLSGLPNNKMFRVGTVYDKDSSGTLTGGDGISAHSSTLSIDGMLPAD